MMVTRRTLLLAVSLLVATAAALPGSAAADAPVAAISAGGATSNISKQVVPLAGEPNRVVYGQTQVLGDGTLGSTDLMAYDGSGTPTDLGPFALEPAGYYPGFSLVGPMLTSDFGADVYHSVSWWNLDAHTSGTTAIAGEYLGSSADGWYYYLDGDVYDETTAGISTEIGQPFSSTGTGIYAADVGPDGLVLGGSGGALVYMTFAGAVTQLQSQWSTYGPKDPFNGVSCSGTTGTYTVCAISLDGGDGPNSDLIAQLVPLDGGTASAVSDTCMGPSSGKPSVALTATALVCADDIVTSQSLTSLRRVHTSSYEVGSGVGYGAPQTVAAFGAAVVSDPAHHKLETVSSATSAPVSLLVAPDSTVTAGSLALTSGRVMWSSDQPLASAPSPTDLSVRSRPIFDRAGVLATGAQRVVAIPAGWLGVAASGRTSAYSKPTVTDGLTTWTVRVVTPEHTTTLRNVIRTNVQVSGNDVLYEAAETPSHPERRYLMLDALTGRSRHVPQLDRLVQVSRETPYGALFGHDVVYLSADHAVRLLDTATGKDTIVAAAANGNEDPMVYGPYVAWGNGNVTGGTGNGYVRDLRTKAKPVKLPTGTFVYALTNSGVVTDDVNDWHSVDNVVVPNTYYVRSYRHLGVASQILSAPEAASRAQVSDAVIAWLDSSNVVRASVIQGDDTVTPRYLTTPDAPKAFRAGKQTWRADLPFSATLTECSVTVERHGKTVSTLACAIGPMRGGDAVVRWDGTTSAGKSVERGRYRWRAKVSSTSAVVQTVNGSVDVR